MAHAATPCLHGVACVTPPQASSRIDDACRAHVPHDCHQPRCPLRRCMARAQAAAYTQRARARARAPARTAHTHLLARKAGVGHDAVPRGLGQVVAAYQVLLADLGARDDRHAVFRTIVELRARQRPRGLMCIARAAIGMSKRCMSACAASCNGARGLPGCAGCGRRHAGPGAGAAPPAGRRSAWRARERAVHAPCFPQGRRRRTPSRVLPLITARPARAPLACALSILSHSRPRAASRARMPSALS